MQSPGHISASLYPSCIHIQLSTVLGAMEERDRCKAPLLLLRLDGVTDNIQNRIELIKSVLVFTLFFNYEPWTEPAFVLQGIS